MMGLITLLMLWTTCSTPTYSASHSAGATSQQPTYAFRSTSRMMATTTTYSREYADPFATSVPKSGPRRAMGDDDDDIGRPGGTQASDPGIGPTTPIGDIPWPLIIVLATGYAALVRTNRRQQRATVSPESQNC